MSAALIRPEIEEEPLQRKELPNGLEFHYVEAGAGIPLVFVHGVLGDWRAWAPQWREFTSHFRCISYSRRYNVPNNNSHSSPDHSAIVEAKDLAALLDTWSAAPAILVGSSYGAYTALALAIDRPELVRTMVLVEPPMLRWSEFTEKGRAARAEFERDIRIPARNAFLDGRDEHAVLLLTGGIIGTDVAKALPPEAMRRRMENVKSIRMLTLSTDEFPMIEPHELASIACPTLLLSGEHTPAVHSTVFDAVTQAMPNARSTRIPAAGHGAARENPAEFNRVVLDFLRSHQLCT